MSFILFYEVVLLELPSAFSESDAIEFEIFSCDFDGEVVTMSDGVHFDGLFFEDDGVSVCGSFVGIVFLYDAIIVSRF